MVNSYSISLKGTLSRWMSYSELGVFCDTVNKKIPCKIVLINSKTNFLSGCAVAVKDALIKYGGYDPMIIKNIGKD